MAFGDVILEPGPGAHFNNDAWAHKGNLMINIIALIFISMMPSDGAPTKVHCNFIHQKYDHIWEI